MGSNVCILICLEAISNLGQAGRSMEINVVVCEA